MSKRDGEFGDWRPIATAPDGDRVIVAGWQPATRSCVGYWWFHEDVIFNGRVHDHPDALLWHPFPDLPTGDPETTLEALAQGEQS